MKMDGSRPMPKVSVIVPVYNTQAYLPACVQSLRSQTYSELEILLVDDGSTDGSRRICQRLAGQDGRVRCILQEHRGVSAARNRGLDAHTGQYVLFLDSDDLLHPLLIEHYVRCLERQPADMLYCAYTYFVEPPSMDAYSRAIPEPIPMPPEKFRMLYLQGKLRGIGGKFIRSQAIGSQRFDESLSFGEDALFTYQLFLRGIRITFCDAAWYFYRQRPDSTCATAQERIGLDAPYIKSGRDAACAAGDENAADALFWEKKLTAALRSYYSRAMDGRHPALCWQMRSHYAEETAHPLFSQLSRGERALFRLCFRCHPAYRAARKAFHLARALGSAAASALTGGKAPVCQGLAGRGDMSLALTFDAHFGAGQTDELLSLLERYGVRATFFVSGAWASAYPEPCAKLARAGHEVMSHTFFHPDLTQCRAEEIRDELARSADAIEAAAGVRPTLVLCPYGACSRRVLASAEEKGLRLIQWSADTQDHIASSSAEDIYQRALAQTKPGGILRFHAGGQYTLPALERLLPELAGRGFRFRPVSEMLPAGSARRG